MGGACPKQADRPEYDIYAACNFAWFLKRSNVELNVQHIESAIQQVPFFFFTVAIACWYLTLPSHHTNHRPLLCSTATGTASSL